MDAETVRLVEIEPETEVSDEINAVVIERGATKALVTFSPGGRWAPWKMPVNSWTGMPIGPQWAWRVHEDDLAKLRGGQ